MDNYGLLRDYSGTSQAGYVGQAQYTYTDPGSSYGYPSQSYRAQYSTPVSVSPQGQWVYTADYGWIWIPSNTVTYAVQNTPCVYLYTPTYGWTWYTSPWGWGRYSHTAWVGRPWPYAFRAWSRGSAGWAWHGAVRSTYYAPHVSVHTSYPRSYGYRSTGGWHNPAVHTNRVYVRDRGGWYGGGRSVSTPSFSGGTRHVVGGGGRSFDGGGSFRGSFRGSSFQSGRGSGTSSGGRQYGGGGGGGGRAYGRGR